MDPLTHGVASFALQRALFPKAKFAAATAMIIAGLMADLDSLTALPGPAAYLAWHRTATHSLLASFLIAPLAVGLTFAVLGAFGVARSGGMVLPFGKGGEPVPAEDLRARVQRDAKAVIPAAVLAAFLSALSHLFMDLGQSDSIALFWPFSAKRFSLDVLPALEPWLLAILIAAILFPELFLLISDEIGARRKRPRGRTGAIVGLSFALLYFGLRTLLHGNTVASLEAHTLGGETPRRVAAFPDSTSPFLWHSVVETESALNLLVMRSMGGEVSYASGVTTLHKPEPSPMLTEAQKAPAALVFVKFARFPKATVQAEATGYSVEIQDLKDQATEELSRAVVAAVDLDQGVRVVSSELQWKKSPAAPH